MKGLMPNLEPKCMVEIFFMLACSQLCLLCIQKIEIPLASCLLNYCYASESAKTVLLEYPGFKSN